MTSGIILIFLFLNFIFGGYCLAKFLDEGGEGNNIAGLYIKDENSKDDDKKDEEDEDKEVNDKESE